MRRFTFTLLTVVLLVCSSTFVKAEETTMVTVRELVDTSGDRRSLAINSSTFNVYQVASDTILKAKLPTDIPNGGVFVNPGVDGMIFYTFIISYTNDTIDYHSDHTLDLSSIDDLSSVSNININYSYAARIVVNRYVDGVLMSTDKHLGRSMGDYSDISINPESLSVSSDYNNYNFLYSDTDLSEALVFDFKNPKVVNLYYDTNIVEQAGTISVHHLDEDGNKLADSTDFTGEIGEPYEVRSLDIDNYTLVSDVNLYEGVHDTEDKSYTFVYKLNEVDPELPDEPGVITVHYLDEDGNTLANSLEVSGSIGKAYTVHALDIDNYTLIGDVHLYEGVHDTEDKSYTFTYKLNVKDDSTPEEKTTDEEVDEKITDKEVEAKPTDKNSIEKLPQTGAINLAYLSIALIFIGSLLLHYTSKKQPK